MVEIQPAISYRKSAIFLGFGYLRPENIGIYVPSFILSVRIASPEKLIRSWGDGGTNFARITSLSWKVIRRHIRKEAALCFSEEG